MPRQEALAAAGYGPGHPLKFELLYNTSVNHKKVVVAVASMWKKLGCRRSLVNQEWKTYLQTKSSGSFDVARAGWIADYNGCLPCSTWKQTTHGNNDGKYSNAAFDKLMADSRSKTDSAERNKIHAQAEAILDKDMPIARSIST